MAMDKNYVHDNMMMYDLNSKRNDTYGLMNMNGVFIIYLYLLFTPASSIDIYI